jgi:hypothetical protein
MESKAPESLGKDMYVPKNIQHNAGVLNFMCGPSRLPLFHSKHLSTSPCMLTAPDACAYDMSLADAWQCLHAVACLGRWWLA